MQYRYTSLDPTPFLEAGDLPHHILPMRAGQRWRVVGAPLRDSEPPTFFEVSRGDGVCIPAHPYAAGDDEVARLAFMAALALTAKPAMPEPRAAYFVIARPNAAGVLHFGLAFLLEGDDA